MIITCPSCSVKFNVPDAAIPPEGRKLKCSKCEFLWHFKPKGIDPATAIAALSSEKPPAPARTARPERALKAKPEPVPVFGKAAPQEKIKPPIWMMAVAAVLLLCSASVAGITWLPDLLGMNSSTGLTLADVVIKPDPGEDGSKTGSYFIEGNLVNTTQDEKNAPHVRIVLSDKTGKEVKTWSIKPDASVITPGARLHFAGPVETGAGEGMKLRLDIGNTLELALRPVK